MEAQALYRVLERHVTELPVGAIEQKRLARSLGGVSFGVMNSSIHRAMPPLDISSLKLRPGKSLALMGPNGSGKSTLFDALMERDQASLHTGMGQGAVLIGKPVHARDTLRVARLDQEEMLDEIGDLTTSEVIEKATAFFKSYFPIDWCGEDLDPAAANQEAQRRIENLHEGIVELFEIDFLNTKVSNLSGGERTKLALFMVLVSEPDLVLLDEPTNHLDLGSITKLSALVDEYTRAGMSIVSASHVGWFLEEIGSDGVLEINWDRKGRNIVESSTSYRKYVKNPNRDKVPLILGDIRWWQGKDHCKEGSVVVEVPLETFSIQSSPLQRVSMPNVIGGSLVVVSGNNGTGKTKLLEAIIRGRKERGPVMLGKGVQAAYLPQFWPEKIARGTVGDFFFWVKENTSPHSNGSVVHPEKPAHKCFVEFVRELHFGGASRIGETWLNRPFSRLSGGEQRVLWFIAVSTLLNVDMLILDEPTNHMDETMQGKVAKAIKRFPGTVMLATHDRNLFVDIGRRMLTDSKGLIHLLLSKRDGGTIIQKSNENPLAYIERIMAEARESAKHFKV